ncbi:MAG: iron chaperone [Actinomycetota bacterium]
MAQAKTVKSAKKAKGSYTGFSAGEKAAMKEYAKELKAAAKAGASRAEGEKALLAAIAKMSRADRALAKRVHAIVTEAAPGLAPKTWYGMPAYANADGKVICFFKNAGKFKERYSTFGFDGAAKLDDGTMWATSFAVTDLSPKDETKLKALVKKAAR